MHKISIAITTLVVAALSLPVSLSAQENTIGTTGNVGIGTGATAPPNRLTIESTNPVVPNYIRMEHKGITNSLLFLGTAPSNYQVTLQQNANVLESYTDLHLSAANTGRIFFETGRTGTAAPVRMILTNTGLGIGTLTPTTSLNVDGGAIRLKNPGLYPYGINIDVDFPAGWAREYSFSYGATGKIFAWGATGTGNALNYGYIGGNSTADVVSATPWMVFKPNGNVGIGTTAPSQRLEIYTAGSSSMQLTNSSDVLGSVGAVRFNMAGSEVSTIEAERTIATGRQSALKFSVRNDAGLIEAMRIADNGNVGIGTTSPGSYKLAVAGTIAARRVKVTQETWPDYVFNKDYKLPALSEVEKYIKENQHLPEIPSAAEVKKEGLDLGEMNEKLLRKVEELTLYMIQQQRIIENQENRLRLLEHKDK